MPLSVPREFQIWEYTVSHGQLLLRSTKANIHKTQIDVLFKNVVFIQLPARFQGLTISEIASDDPRAAAVSLGEFSLLGQTIFLVEGDAWTGVVVAGAVYFLEDESTHNDQSKLLPDFRNPG